MGKEKPSVTPAKAEEKPAPKQRKTGEYGGFEDKGLPEPTRYGDWESGGRCSDF